MLFTEVVAASAAVGATRARTAKAATLAALLRAATPAEVEPATAWLAGEARQGRIGTGWRTLSGIDAPPAAEPTLTVEAVDTTLDALAATAGAGSTKRRAELLHGLFAAATREEQRFLTTLLGGELRHGALEGVMLEAVAAAAEVPAAVVRRAFMLSGRLPETARLALDGGEPALAAVTLQVGRPVRPMLASPGDSLDAALAGLGPDVTVEYKLDGARIQVHRDGDDVRVWTRTLREITAGVPELVAQVRALPGRAFVLDGETLALDDDGRPRAFQDTMSRFGSDGLDDSAAVLLSPFFFDLLHLDGTDLLDEPLQVRLDALAALLAEHPALRMPGVRRPTAGAGRRRARRRALRGPRGRGRRRRSTPPTRRGGAARPGRRSSRCTRSTWWCSARSGATGGAPGRCPTSTSAPATPTAASRSWSARRSRA